MGADFVVPNLFEDFDNVFLGWLLGICEDIRNLSDEYLKSLNESGEIVGVIGGPPCQGYSTVGTRDINDPRNHLYLQYCRVVENVKPDFFVLENVKGLTTLGRFITIKSKPTIAPRKHKGGGSLY